MPERVLQTDPMTPVPFRIDRVRRELSDTFSLELLPPAGIDRFSFGPGQFNMLYQFGVGEAPISISSDPAEPSRLVHTIRTVGGVTAALSRLRPGASVGVRGPFGTSWPVQEAEGRDVVIIAGGIGLAPLRPAIYEILRHRQRYGNVVILYGARTPADILFRRQIEKWRGRLDVSVDVTVDSAGSDWVGNVGVVTSLIPRAHFDPVDAVAMICGPEMMMRFTVKALNEMGVGDERIHVSMERNMKCALGFCGHCQFGPEFVCKDGPVFSFERIRELFSLREI